MSCGSAAREGQPFTHPAAVTDVEVSSWKELLARAGSEFAAQRLLRDEGWWRVWRGWYAPRCVPDGPAVRLAAVQAALPAGTTPSHRTALWVLGLDVLGGGVLDVTVSRGRHLERRPGIVSHAAALPPEELTAVDGLVIVSAARAVVDVARREPLAEAVAVADAALRAGWTTVPLIQASIERAAHLRGVVAARAMLPMLEPRSESQMESRLRVKLVVGGLPRPAAQYDVYDDDGHVGRADLWLDGVAIEYDGWLEKRAQSADRRRHARFEEVGCLVRRYTATDCYQRSAPALVGEITRAITLARGLDRSGMRGGPDTLRPPRFRPHPTLADPPNDRAA